MRQHVAKRAHLARGAVGGPQEGFAFGRGQLFALALAVVQAAIGCGFHRLEQISWHVFQFGRMRSQAQADCLALA